MCLFAIYISAFVSEIFLHVFSSFSNVLFGDFYCLYWDFFTYSRYYILVYVFTSLSVCSLSFHPLDKVFAEQKLLILKKSDLSIFLQWNVFGRQV